MSFYTNYYAIAVQLNVPKYGVISWVAQLVVHEDYRHKDVSKNILSSTWGFSDNYAFGWRNAINGVQKAIYSYAYLKFTQVICNICILTKKCSNQFWLEHFLFKSVALFVVGLSI